MTENKGISDISDIIVEQLIIKSTYDIMDFVNNEGYFKFKNYEEAKEKLGNKVEAIKNLVMNADGNITVKFYNRLKYLKQLNKYIKSIDKEDRRSR